MTIKNMCKRKISVKILSVGTEHITTMIMNFTKQDTEQFILKTVAKTDKGLMQAIQDNMFAKKQSIRFLIVKIS